MWVLPKSCEIGTQRTNTDKKMQGCKKMNHRRIKWQASIREHHYFDQNTDSTIWKEKNINFLSWLNLNKQINIAKGFLIWHKIIHISMFKGKTKWYSNTKISRKDKGNYINGVQRIRRNDHSWTRANVDNCPFLLLKHVC